MDKLMKKILLDLVTDDWNIPGQEPGAWNRSSALKAIESIKNEAANCLYASDRYKRAENLVEIAMKVKDDEVRSAAVEALTSIRDQALYASDRKKVNELILKVVIGD